VKWGESVVWGRVALMSAPDLIRALTIRLFLRAAAKISGVSPERFRASTSTR